MSAELKNKLKAKPYDPKKSCWVPNKATHGYDEGLIDSTEGDKVTVMILESKEVMAMFHPQNRQLEICDYFNQVKFDGFLI